VSPVVHRGSVYVGGLDGVYALDARDGSPRWSRETSGSVNEAVLGRDDRVFASTGETLLALDTRGQEGWTYTTGDDRFSTAAPAAGSGYVLYDTGAWERRRHPARHCWGPADGWRYAPETDFDTPTVVDGDAYIPGDRLHALSAATGEVRWTAPYDRQPASRPTGTGSTSRSMTGRWWRSTPRMAPSAGVSPLASEEGVFLRTRPLVTERSVIVTTEKPGLDEPANTFAVDRRNRGGPLATRTTR